MKILLADKDPEALDVTTYALRRYGFEVTAVRDGLQALRCWKDSAPDLVLAEVDLPGMSGFELCREIRQHSATPVIIVSARNTDEDVVQGFQLGADDYIMKPLRHRPLAMRIRAILNRATGAPVVNAHEGELRAGRLRLDLESHEVFHGTRVVRLTPIEFRIFYLLMLNPGKVVSSARLIEYAWGYEGADATTLKMHISRIRQKLNMHGTAGEHIASVRWVGYALKDGQSERSGAAIRTGSPS
jgi:two-component system, OmpR family, response regulator MtrA